LGIITKVILAHEHLDKNNKQTLLQLCFDDIERKECAALHPLE
jgi:hypothetical protein